MRINPRKKVRDLRELLGQECLLFNEKGTPISRGTLTFGNYRDGSFTEQLNPERAGYPMGGGPDLGYYIINKSETPIRLFKREITINHDNSNPIIIQQHHAEVKKEEKYGVHSKYQVEALI